jgi:hypothetical protein
VTGTESGEQSTIILLRTGFWMIFQFIEVDYDKLFYVPFFPFPSRDRMNRARFCMAESISSPLGKISEGGSKKP